MTLRVTAAYSSEVPGMLHEFMNKGAIDPIPFIMIQWVVKRSTKWKFYTETFLCSNV